MFKPIFVVTGVNVHFITPILCIICIFYTSLVIDKLIVIYKLILSHIQGGIKAVVWTDVIQAMIMFGAIVLVAIKGTLDVGGFGVVMERSLNSDRIESPKLVQK